MFILFDNKKSTLKRNCRYVQGGSSEIDGDKIKWWERTTFIKNRPDDIIYKITKETEFRPDIVSYILYESTAYDWLILQYTNIIDLLEEFSAGTTLLLPSKSRVLLELTSKNIRYT